MIPGTPRPTSVADLPPWERYGRELLSINMIDVVRDADPETVALIAAFVDGLRSQHGLILHRDGGYWSVRMSTPEGGALEALRRAQRSWDEALPIEMPDGLAKLLDAIPTNTENHPEEGDH